MHVAILSSCTYKNITSDRNEVWAWDLHHSTALVEGLKVEHPLYTRTWQTTSMHTPRLKKAAAAAVAVC